MVAFPPERFPEVTRWFATGPPGATGKPAASWLERFIIPAAHAPSYVETVAPVCPSVGESACIAASDCKARSRFSTCFRAMEM